MIQAVGYLRYREDKKGSVRYDEVGPTGGSPRVPFLGGSYLSKAGLMQFVAEGTEEWPNGFKVIIEPYEFPAEENQQSAAPVSGLRKPARAK